MMNVTDLLASSLVRRRRRLLEGWKQRTVPAVVTIRYEQDDGLLVRRRSRRAALLHTELEAEVEVPVEIEIET